MTNDESTSLTIRLSSDFKDRLERVAESDGRAVSNYILHVLRRHLDGEGRSLRDAIFDAWRRNADCEIAFQIIGRASPEVVTIRSVEADFVATEKFNTQHCRTDSGVIAISTIVSFDVRRARCKICNRRHDDEGVTHWVCGQGNTGVLKDGEEFFTSFSCRTWEGGGIVEVKAREPGYNQGYGGKRILSSDRSLEYAKTIVEKHLGKKALTIIPRDEAGRTDSMYYQGWDTFAVSFDTMTHAYLVAEGFNREYGSVSEARICQEPESTVIDVARAVLKLANNTIEEVGEHFPTCPQCIARCLKAGRTSPKA